MSDKKRFEQTYTPAICRLADGGKEPAFEGTLTLRRPTRAEREQLAELLEGDAADEIADRIEEIEALDGAVLSPEQRKAAQAKARAENIKWRKALNRLISEALPKFFVSCSIKRLEDGFTFDSLEALDVDSDMELVLIEAATKLISRYSLGKQI